MLWREIESLSGTVIQCSFCILLGYIVVGENNGEVVVVVVVVGGEEGRFIHRKFIYGSSFIHTQRIKICYETTCVCFLNMFIQRPTGLTSYYVFAQILAVL